MKTNMLWAALLVAMIAVPAAASQPSDTWITTKTKVALLADGDVDGTKLNVDTSGGVVTLYGTLPTHDQHHRAIEVAKGIEGVTSVRDYITVSPEPNNDAPKAPKAVANDKANGKAKANGKVTPNDARVRADVETALRSKRLEGSNIKVASVNDGVVVLSGNADSLSDQRVALARARSVKGVRRVTDQITAQDTFDTQDWRQRELKDGKVASTAGDAWITSAVKLRLLADETTPGLAINVDTDDRVVTLFGIVPTAEVKAKAEAEAKQVEDVDRVVNALQVVAENKQAAVERKDDEILTAVKDAIDKDVRLDDGDIDVEVKNGVVRLTGTVTSFDDRVLAAQRARAVAGVRAVRQEIEVKVATKSAAK